MNVPVIRFDHCEASRAYALYAAMMRLRRDLPSLNDDPLFHVFLSEALERFNRAFGGVE